MKLKTWLQHCELTHRDFAKMVGKSQQAVTRWVNGERVPNVNQMATIHRITRGKVSLFDWVRRKA
jgi:transcriptional regulator with XRE-family HTH domain